jgi:hypothetical protein
LIHIARDTACRGRAFFDSTAAASGKDDHWRAGRVIDGERKKKLPVDVDFFLNQHSFDWKLSNFHLQHSRSMRANFIRLFRERDATDAGATCRPGLNLDDDLATELRRCRHGFSFRPSRVTARDFESFRGKNRFTLILVKARHGWLLFPMKTRTVQR